MQIIYEDNHIVAVNKKVSDIVQGDKTGDRTLGDEVKDYIKAKYNKPGNVFLGVTHRLDRPVSGVTLFARTSKALSRLNEMFKERDFKKTYWAVTKNPPPKNEDTLVHYLVRNEKQNKAIVHLDEVKDSKMASLSYKVIGKSDNYYFVEIELHTGRHHQIRAQLSAMGCPIKGDLKYGSPRSNKDGGIHLHARSMEFNHPIKLQRVKIVAEPPADALWKAFLETV